MLPKHHKSSFFLKTGIFDNLSSFAELEKRISDLPTPVEEGDAFEVFAEAYFFTQKIEQAEEVWPFKSIPTRIKENLSLGTSQQDKGVDGVFKTVTDEFNAYQAKFRKDRTSITWSDLATFMGLTDKVNQRVLFTNSNDITSVINERTGFYCIRGNDLDRLEKNDFNTILKWLKSGVLEVERKTPQPHQDGAIRDILNTLKDEDRATALMACGTGKTLVALWVSEQMDCQNILVLLPSLTLVRQTLHEWLKETKWQHLAYLCVCSDPTVAGRELDNIIINQSDLDFAVTTEGIMVKQFLSQYTKGVKIVFSTYQSAHIVAEGMDKNYRFDLGIFDEAHKTAGREGKKFGFALNDDNLNIKKRLFLTATPRHYNKNKKDKEGEFALVYSMDNPDIYGQVAHKLSFAKAAIQGIICNYKVIISVVTSEQINKEMLKRGEVVINGDIVNAQEIANQIAFKEAISKYNIRRIFTFHKSVKSAKLFTGKDSEGIRTQLPEFNTFHVNGTMPTALREGIMHEFKDSDRSIISNARCLTEGVDLPAVDMVAFMSPKKSKVDIVQATGRAMRKDPQNPDKTLGYILVPLYLEITTEERIEDAVSKANFEEVWNVLQALQDQDEVLADIIRQMQENKGKGDGDGGVIIDPIDIIGQNISLKTLQESITAVCVDKLGFTWDLRYGELIKYREIYGDCNVYDSWGEYYQLSNWVSTQRVSYRNGKLSVDRIKRLEDIGFSWDTHSLYWEEKFEELKEYMNIHGDCNVPSNWGENKQLANWVRTQRNKYRNEQLSQDRIKHLDSIGFEWEESLSEREWEESLSEGEEFNLSLRQDVWKLKDSSFSWEEMFEALKKYKKDYGDCNVSVNTKLGEWVLVQRANYIKGQLNKHCIKCLEDIDFKWGTEEESEWEKLFDLLKEYKKDYGDCNVPTDCPNQQLASWVYTQRHSYQKGELRKSRIKRLEDIGFEWKSSKKNEMMEHGEESREEKFDVLQVNKNKHIRIPSKKEDKKANYKKKTWKVSSKKASKEISKVKWKEMFYALKEYKKIHGDCNVPTNWQKNKKLTNWMGAQRLYYRHKKLSKYRIKRLEDIGFEWEIRKR